jgi:cytochrome b561
MPIQTDGRKKGVSAEPAGFVWRDGIDRYGLISRFNHWFGAAVVITLLAIGLYFEDMPRGAEKFFWLKLHIGIGALAFFILAFRLLWRLTSGSPAAFAQTSGMQRLALAVHILLLSGLGVLIISGPLSVWTGGHAIDVFGWFSIPSPTGKIAPLHESLEVVHKVMAKVLLVAIILHVLAALKHFLFDRGRIFGRMLGR